MQDNKNKYSQFSYFFIKNFEALSLQKVVVSNARNKNGDLKNISIKPVAIKGIMQLSFVYHYTTKDITKNFVLDEALKHIESLIKQEFQQIDVFTNTGNLFLKINKKNEITITEKEVTETKKSI